MCGTCGCEAPSGTRTLELERDVLAKNDAIAEHNRLRLNALDAVAINLMSSPGSGKTTLLEATLRALDGRSPVAVVEGDQAASLDADRLRALGCRTVQLNTGSGCHLDAEMLDRALAELDLEPGTVLFVENVGNLVCPALFDLGEQHKVVLAATTEGEDKPLKYPHMFRAADLVLLTKTDLLPHLDFDEAHFASHLSRINPRARLLSVCAPRGDGMDQWLGWLRSARSVPSGSASAASSAASSASS